MHCFNANANSPEANARTGLHGVRKKFCDADDNNNERRDGITDDETHSTVAHSKIDGPDARAHCSSDRHGAAHAATEHRPRHGRADPDLCVNTQSDPATDAVPTDAVPNENPDSAPNVNPDGQTDQPPDAPNAVPNGSAPGSCSRGQSRLPGDHCGVPNDGHQMQRCGRGVLWRTVRRFRAQRRKEQNGLPSRCQSSERKLRGAAQGHHVYQRRIKRRTCGVVRHSPRSKGTSRTP